jgi:hypothetical protein
MKKFRDGRILFDAVDIFCVCFSTGSLIAYAVRRYHNWRRIKITGEDIIVTELKKKSPINVFSEKGNPLKFPIIRGGDEIQIFSMTIKSKKLLQIMTAIINARETQKKLKLLRYFLFILNGLLTTSTGLRIAVGGSLTFTQIILIALPATAGGFLMGTISAYPLASTLLPMLILFGRGIEDVPDPQEKCRLMCKAAENYHNKQLMVEMKNLDSRLVDAAAALQLPVNEVPLVCTEQPFSLLERYKLKAVIKNGKLRERTEHFRKFMKGFPECGADPKTVYQEVIGNVQNITTTTNIT